MNNRKRYIEDLGELDIEVSQVILESTRLCIILTHSKHPIFGNSRSTVWLNNDFFYENSQKTEKLFIPINNTDSSFPASFFQLEGKAVSALKISENEFRIEFLDVLISCPLSYGLETVLLFPDESPDCFIF